MTDNEIIKALEGKLPLGIHAIHEAIDLINRQKAEIKRLTSGKCVYLSDDETTEYCVEGPCPKYKTEEQIKAEAVKEFAERLKKELSFGKYTNAEQIDNLVKEMAGEG